VGEPDPPLLHRGCALRQRRRLLTDRRRVKRRLIAHMALVTQPVMRRRVAGVVVLVGGGEGGGTLGELQLDEVARVAQLDQVVAQLRGQPLTPWPRRSASAASSTAPIAGSGRQSTRSSPTHVHRLTPANMPAVSRTHVRHR
jgi:hypothetical protein